MFKKILGVFGIRPRPKDPVEQFILDVYGDTPPPKRADVKEAIVLANELLMDAIDPSEVGRKTIELNEGPIPYTTEELAVSVALHFFRQPENVAALFEVQLFARMTVLMWCQERRVASAYLRTFEEALYKLYRPNVLPDHMKP